MIQKNNFKLKERLKEHFDVFFQNKKRNKIFPIIKLTEKNVKENELNEISEILLMDNNENFDRFVQFVEKRNLVDGGDGFSYEDHYLTLMTCEYSNKNGRFFVIAKRIAENK